jgi:hypothetical protein
VVKKDGVYFLYYIGADGDRSTDGGPRHRALGVATSKDGIRFEKHSGNPIIKFLPNNNEEEGVFSAAATLDATGNILLYYGAMDAGSQYSTWVTSDVRLAVSRDGFQFTDMGIALSYRDKSVWGYGDELFPVGSFQSDGIWHVYYIAKSGVRRFLSYVTGTGMGKRPAKADKLEKGACVGQLHHRRRRSCGFRRRSYSVIHRQRL